MQELLNYFHNLQVQFLYKTINISALLEGVQFLKNAVENILNENSSPTLLKELNAVNSILENMVVDDKHISRDNFINSYKKLTLSHGRFPSKAELAKDLGHDYSSVSQTLKRYPELQNLKFISGNTVWRKNYQENCQEIYLNLVSSLGRYPTAKELAKELGIQHGNLIKFLNFHKTLKKLEFAQEPAIKTKERKLFAPVEAPSATRRKYTKEGIEEAFNALLKSLNRAPTPKELADSLGTTKQYLEILVRRFETKVEIFEVPKVSTKEKSLQRDQLRQRYKL